MTSIKPIDVVSSNSDTLSYEFDKRRRFSDAIKDLREYWEENKVQRELQEISTQSMEK